MASSLSGLGNLSSLAARKRQKVCTSLVEEFAVHHKRFGDNLLQQLRRPIPKRLRDVSGGCPGALALAGAFS